ncbi:MAG: hypothetical protein AAGB22_14625, partial [Bacteroidota bacterium]
MTKRTIVAWMDRYVAEVKTGRAAADVESDLLEEGLRPDELKEVRKSINRLGLLLDGEKVQRQLILELGLVGRILFYLGTATAFTTIAGFSIFNIPIMIIEFSMILLGLELMRRARQKKYGKGRWGQD